MASTAAITARRVVRSLLDIDHELENAVPERDRAEARQQLVGVQVRLAPGVARPYDLPSVTALYVADGVLVHEVTVGTAALPEIVVVGDFLRPRPVTDALAWGQVGLLAIGPVTLLALDERFAEATVVWPALRAVVERRAAERHHRAMLLGAIGHLPRVEQRVIALLWLLATEWGQDVPEGLVVPFTLTHGVIGRFVGAARSTVSLAAAELSALRLVERRSDGSWLLPHGTEVEARALLGVPEELPAVAMHARMTRHNARELRRQAQETVQEARATVQEAGALTAEAAQSRGRGLRP